MRGSAALATVANTIAYPKNASRLALFEYHIGGKGAGVRFRLDPNPIGCNRMTVAGLDRDRPALTRQDVPQAGEAGVGV